MASGSVQQKKTARHLLSAPPERRDMQKVISGLCTTTTKTRTTCKRVIKVIVNKGWQQTGKFYMWSYDCKVAWTSSCKANESRLFPSFILIDSFEITTSLVRLAMFIQTLNKLVILELLQLFCFFQHLGLHIHWGICDWHRWSCQTFAPGPNKSMITGRHVRITAATVMLNIVRMKFQNSSRP